MAGKRSSPPACADFAAAAAAGRPLPPPRGAVALAGAAGALAAVSPSRGSAASAGPMARGACRAAFARFQLQAGQHTCTALARCMPDGRATAGESE